ncbi:MAG: hypothetical protein ERJ68_02415 [Aphanocapsa feldmannii 277cI]|uniref:DNA primase/helicase Gp4 N-terminal Bacteriophage T7-like domain-containing protein n=1 Tax=Aphanocapsa feldmannii 277cI TaxID=2507554 RepID=A0A524RUS7_9CHRO|nr:MAG: hypothetical protein ERJ68_02415 [Aphanocapsa feldmannii 277cI]
MAVNQAGAPLLSPHLRIHRDRGGGLRQGHHPSQPCSVPARTDRIYAQAHGRWPEILGTLGGLTDQQLSNRHQPCPICGGTDRYRYDDRGDGNWYCNQCGGKDGHGGGGRGIHLLQQVTGWDWRQTCSELEHYLGLSDQAGHGQRSAGPLHPPLPTRRKGVRHTQQHQREEQISAPELPITGPIKLLPLDPYRFRAPSLPYPDGHILRYDDQHQVRVIWRKDPETGETITGARSGKPKRDFYAFHGCSADDGERYIKGAGTDVWPFWNHRQITSPTRSAVGYTVIEAEGEKCADILCMLGVVGISHPGICKQEHRIARYRWLASEGIRLVIYLADHDRDGEQKAIRCQQAAATAGLPLLILPAAAVWDGLPQGGSIDDAVAPDQFNFYQPDSADSGWITGGIPWMVEQQLEDCCCHTPSSLHAAIAPPAEVNYRLNFKATSSLSLIQFRDLTRRQEQCQQQWQRDTSTTTSNAPALLRLYPEPINRLRSCLQLLIAEHNRRYSEARGRVPIPCLEAIAGHTISTITICGSLASADALQTVFPPEDFRLITTTIPLDGPPLERYDFSTLRDRRVALWPDDTLESREQIARLAPRLARDGVERIEIISPPTDEADGARSGWTIADWLNSDPPWNVREVQDYVRANKVSPQIDSLSEDVEEESDPESACSSPATSADAAPQRLLSPSTPTPFRCLGYDDAGYYFAAAAGDRIIRISQSAIVSSQLLNVAPLTYWEDNFPGSRSSVSWQSAGDHLIQQQSRVGPYDSERVRGRGVWSDDGRTVFHLGDRLLVDGVEHDSLAGFPSRCIYPRRSRLLSLDHPLGSPLSDDEGLAILSLAQRFHWQASAAGHLLAGWAALAPICGALCWRPHLWLTGAAGTGKTELIEHFLKPLLAGTVLHLLGATTEAGMRQRLQQDARPVLFDEIESNERHDRDRVQNILGLCRVSSTESGAELAKGTPGGVAIRYQARFMACFSSINTALRQGADHRRFCILSLTRPSSLSEAERQDHWARLKPDLLATITPESGHRLLARSIELCHVIEQSVATFREAATTHFQSRPLGDQLGTLLAGAWCLSTSTPPTEADATTYLAGLDWTDLLSGGDASSDERRCLDTILDHQLRVETSDGIRTRTIAELIRIACSRSLDDILVSADLAQATLGRHGLRVQLADDIHLHPSLYVSNTAQGIRGTLSDTSWGENWQQTLRRLPGAISSRQKAAEVVCRFGGIATRYIDIPLATVFPDDP